LSNQIFITSTVSLCGAYQPELHFFYWLALRKQL